MKSVNGLGDIIELATKFFGIKWLVDKIWKGNCSCERRKKILNEKFPINNNLK